MALYKRREKFSGLSVKIGTVFAKFGLSPNQWTIITLIPAFVAVWFLIKDQFVLAAVLFLVASFIDMIDGSVARVTGKVTRFGAYLDTIIDRYVEAIILVGLLFVSLPAFPGTNIPIYVWIFVYLYGGMMTTYAKAAAKEKELIKPGVELKGGILERAERLIILFIGILLASVDPLYLTYIIVILAVLTNISALQRIWIARKLSKTKKIQEVVLD